MIASLRAHFFAVVLLECDLLLVSLQPLQTTLIGQVLNLETLECSLEAVAVGAGSHHTYHHGQ